MVKTETIVSLECRQVRPDHLNECGSNGESNPIFPIDIHVERSDQTAECRHPRMSFQS
jgi:hypothetical protein